MSFDFHHRRGLLTTGNADAVRLENRDLTDAELAEFGEYLRQLPRLEGISIRSLTLTDDELRYFHDLRRIVVPDANRRQCRGQRVVVLEKLNELEGVELI